MLLIHQESETRLVTNMYKQRYRDEHILRRINK